MRARGDPLRRQARTPGSSGLDEQLGVHAVGDVGQLFADHVVDEFHDAIRDVT